MAHKSNIRREIERILGTTFNSCYVDGRKGKVVKARMKLVTDTPATEKQIEQIMELPHVVKVGYTETTAYTYCGGITIHFSEYPKNIDVEVKPHVIGHRGRVITQKTEEERLFDLANDSDFCLAVTDAEMKKDPLKHYAFMTIGDRIRLIKCLEERGFKIMKI